MVLAMAASWLNIHDLAMWSLGGADLGTTGRRKHLRNMSNNASRKRRKAALAAIPRFAAKELIGLKLLDIEWNPINPPFIDELPKPVTLSDLVNEVRRGRAVLFQQLLDGTYVSEG